MNLKPRVSESNSGATSQKKADVTSKDTAVKATEHASDIHTDIVESNSAVRILDGLFPNFFSRIRQNYYST